MNFWGWLKDNDITPGDVLESIVLLVIIGYILFWWK